MPLDGVVIDGESSLNTTALTGESLPSDVKRRRQRYQRLRQYVGSAACTHDRNLRRIYSLERFCELVENSDNGKANTEKFITRFAKIYTPIVVACAVLLAVIPSLITGDSGRPGSSVHLSFLLSPARVRSLYRSRWAFSAESAERRSIGVLDERLQLSGGARKVGDRCI
jgi:cation transport ATPase